MPTYTSKIGLPHKYNNFSIEFAALTYKNPELNRYAYRLQNFDSDWQYTDADRRFAGSIKDAQHQTNGNKKCRKRHKKLRLRQKNAH